MSEILQYPAELTSYKTYSTKRNVTCTFELQEELQPEHLVKLLSAKGRTGWLVFSSTETKLKQEDIPNEPIKEKGTKSPSERLRATLFVYWKTCTNQAQPFDRFREDYMEKIIESIKAKLPQQE